MMDLNDRQREAIEATDGPVLVLASAGSGKTTVLAERIAYLIESGNAQPWEILAITYTNKAAREMRDRVERRIDTSARDMWISTFHAMCVRMLRKFGERLGYASNFVIFDTADSMRVLKPIVKDWAGDNPASDLQKLITGYKNSAREMPFGEYAFSRMGIPRDRAQSAYNLYLESLHDQNAMDFDDLLLNTLQLLESDPDMRAYYQEKFKYVLIDEYQDTNPVQYKIARILAEGHGNIFAVGDDDQAIYAFRGATVRNILEFEHDYPGAHVIRLEQNYRSDQRILDVANSVIARNKDRQAKSMWSTISGGELPLVRIAKDEREEASFICGDIRDHHDEGMNYSSVAILYRTHAVARAIEDKLRNNAIPYRIYGGQSFYDRKEIKDMVAYLSIIANPESDMHLLRILNTPKRGIGQMKLAQLEQISREHDIPYIEALRDARKYISDKVLTKKAEEFWDMYRLISDGYTSRPVREVVERTYELSGYRQMLADENTPDARTRMENVEELINAAAEYDSGEAPVGFVDFLQRLSLLTDQDKSAEDDAVTLMTMHAAKGLEFDNVYLAGMVDGLFPSRTSIEEGQEDEERRLCYVALTRARNRLVMVSTNIRRIHGQLQTCQRSRFLDEIPDDQKVVHDPKADQQGKGPTPRRFFSGNSAARKAQPERKFFSGGAVIPRAPKPISNEYSIGCRVRHEMFGCGTVKNMSGQGAGTVALVVYDDGHEKTMSLAYSNLMIIPQSEA